MFCPSCGVKNEDDVKFCAACGAEVVDNQPATKDILPLVGEGAVGPVQAGGMTLGTQGAMAKLKALPKRMKVLSVGALVLIVAVIVLVAVGSATTSPKSIAKGYFEAKMNRDWAKVYSYLVLTDSDFVNYKNFAQLMEAQKQPEIVNYEISELMQAEYGIASTGWVKMYNADYLVKDDVNTRAETIVLTKQGNKKFLVFSQYAVVIENLVSSNFTLTVPENSVVFLDEIELTENYAQSNGVGATTQAQSPNGVVYAEKTYILPKLFSKEYQVRVEHPEFGVFSGAMQIGGDGMYQVVSAGMFVPPLSGAGAEGTGENAPPVGLAEGAGAPTFVFTETTYQDVAEVFALFYSSYVEAINAQDVALVEYCGAEVLPYLQERLAINKDFITENNSIKIDRSSISERVENGTPTVKILMQLDNSFVNRATGAPSRVVSLWQATVKYDIENQRWYIAESARAPDGTQASGANWEMVL